MLQIYDKSGKLGGKDGGKERHRRGSRSWEEEEDRRRKEENDAFNMMTYNDYGFEEGENRW